VNPEDDLPDDMLVRIIALACAAVSALNTTPEGVIDTAEAFRGYIENGIPPR